MKSEIQVWPKYGGSHVVIETGPSRLWLKAQEAYDLHQALAAVLPQLVQPFQPYPRD